MKLIVIGYWLFESRWFNEKSSFNRRNPDEPEQIATKAPRHKAKRVTFWLIFIFASLCLGGVNVLPQNAKNSQLRL
jgi:hypothetical protein